MAISVTSPIPTLVPNEEFDVLKVLLDLLVLLQAAVESSPPLPHLAQLEIVRGAVSL